MNLKPRYESLIKQRDHLAQPAFAAVFTALALFGASSAGLAEAAPDPAAHSVIVPYDGKAPDTSAGPKRYYLDYADFKRLWETAKENRRPPIPEQEGVKAEAVINSALYDAEIQDERFVLNARLSVVTRGGSWVRLPLGFKGDGLSVSDVKLDGQTAVLGADGLLIEKAGAHNVEVTVIVVKNRGWQDVSLDLPRAAASMLAVTVPDRDGKPTLSRSGSLSVESTVAGHRVFTYPLGSSSDLRLQRQPFRKLADEALPASSAATLDIEVLTRTEKVSAEVSYSFAGTQRKRFTVRMDDTLKPVSWSMPLAHEMTMRDEGGARLVDIVLVEPVSDQFKLRMTAERVLPTSLGHREAPLVVGMATRSTAEVQLRHSADVQLAADANAQRVQSNPSPPAKATPDLIAAGSFRLSAGEKFGYTIAAAEDRSSAHVDEVYQMSAQKAEIIALIVMNTGRAPLQEAKIGVPAGFEVQTLTGPRVLSWHREGDELIIHLDSNPMSEARLVVHVAKTIPQPSPAWALEPLKLPQFKKQDSKVLIAVHAADDVTLSFDAAKRDIREVDPANVQSALNVAPPLAVKRALVVDAATWKASVTLARQTPKFAVDAVLLAQATDEGLKLSQQTGVVIEQGMLNSVKLRLAKDLPEARVLGPLVRDARSSIAGEQRVYEVTFQSDVLERADFTMEFELPIDGQKTLPVILVDGAARSRRFFIVDNASSREMTTDAGAAEKVVKESLPYIPDGVVRPEFYRVSDKASLKLAFSQLESSAGNAAIVTLAEITSALRTNGERWDSVVYSLANRSLQFLPVKLPPGAELIEVSVAGQPVRADTADSAAEPKGGRAYLVPLIQMKPGELSQQVKLVYRLKAGRDRDVLNQPELIGLSVERTLWNVWVPERHELTKWDGNMEEVTEEVREYEKKHELLGDLARMNRVMASKDVKASDWQMACDNANKILSQLKESKPTASSFIYSRSEQKVATKGAKLQGEAQLAQVQEDVKRQVEVQGALLQSNSGNLQMNQKAAPQKQLALTGSNTWNSQTTGQTVDLNGNTQYFKNSISNASATDNFALNDNIVVSQGALSQTLDAKPAAGAKASKEVTSNAIAVNGGATTNLSVLGGNNAITSNARANTYAGTTVVSGGTLTLGNGDSGAAALTNQGANTTSNFSGVITGDIAGAAALTKSGSGTLTLDGKSTFSGGVTLNGGALVYNGSGQSTDKSMTQPQQAAPNEPSLVFNDSGGTTQLSAATASPVTGNLGTALVGAAASSGNQFASYLSTPTGAVNSVQLGTAGSKSGTLTFGGTGGVALTPANNTYAGATDVNGGTLTISGGVTTITGTGSISSNQPIIANAVQEATRGLQMADNFKNLGEFDKAAAEYQKVLGADKNNTSARRGLEEVEQRKGQYFDSARDHQRAKMLNMVSDGWEEKVPTNVSGIAEREILRRNAEAVPMAAADPFGAPESAAPRAQPVQQADQKKRNVTINSAILPGPAKPAALKPDNGRLTGTADEAVLGDVPPPQLKPVGRVSLAVEVPLEGTVHHFRKLKDHAKLDLTIAKPMEARQTNALWTLIIGLSVVAAISLIKKIRLPRSAALATS
jgi:autotransporter-associated beta strand protein